MGRKRKPIRQHSDFTRYRFQTSARFRICGICGKRIPAMTRHIYGFAIEEGKPVFGRCHIDCCGPVTQESSKGERFLSFEQLERIAQSARKRKE